MHYVLCLCILYSSVFFDRIDIVDKTVRLKDRVTPGRYGGKPALGI